MKKLSLLLLSMAVAVCAMAEVKSHGNAFRDLTTTSAVSKILGPSQVNVITEEPEGTAVNYIRTGEYLLSSLFGYDTDYQSGRVKIVYAEDGHTVYIKDILCYGEGTGVWVVGELSEDGLSIAVPLGQYIAYNADFDYGVILAWGSTEVIDLGDDLYWLDFYVDERAEYVFYSIDPENGTITMEGSEGSVDNPYPYNCVATGLCGLWSDDGSVATIEWGSTWTKLGETLPAIPANPEAIEFFDCGNEEGYTRFDFNINLMDVDGEPINPDYLTYSIFTDDDELFTFDVETYGSHNDIEADMTEIPYGFSGEDFYLRRVYFYRTNTGDNPMFTWRIGIQLNYTVNGVTNKSDIVYLEVYDQPSNPSAVNELNESKQVASVRYFNIAGQEMTQPAGLTIQVTTYSDGTTSATKVIK